LADIPKEVEEAATCLGARPLQVFWHVLLPSLLPAWITGFALAFARGVGEDGSVVFLAGNIPLKTETLPLLLVSKLDQYDYAAAPHGARAGADAGPHPLDPRRLVRVLDAAQRVLLALRELQEHQPAREHGQHREQEREEQAHATEHHSSSFCRTRLRSRSAAL